MKLAVSNQKFFEKSSIVFATIIRYALYILMLITIAAIVTVIVKSGLGLFHAIHDPLETILEDVLLDAVFILALVEITSTILGYLKDGAVHVRYIVDTVLIIMLNEVVSSWFKHPSLQNAIGLSVLIGTLVVARVVLTRFSPVHDK